jgi:hypothetical protein
LFARRRSEEGAFHRVRRALAEREIDLNSPFVAFDPNVLDRAPNGPPKVICMARQALEPSQVQSSLRDRCRAKAAGSNAPEPT